MQLVRRDAPTLHEFPEQLSTMTWQVWLPNISGNVIKEQNYSLLADL